MNCVSNDVCNCAYIVSHEKMSTAQTNWAQLPTRTKKGTGRGGDDDEGDVEEEGEEEFVPEDGDALFGSASRLLRRDTERLPDQRIDILKLRDANFQDPANVREVHVFRMIYY